jgi:hypothetical protein
MIGLGVGQCACEWTAGEVGCNITDLVACKILGGWCGGHLNETKGGVRGEEEGGREGIIGDS